MSLRETSSECIFLCRSGWIPPNQSGLNLLSPHTGSPSRPPLAPGLPVAFLDPFPNHRLGNSTYKAMHKWISRIVVGYLFVSFGKNRGTFSQYCSYSSPKRSRSSFSSSKTMKKITGTAAAAKM